MGKLRDLLDQIDRPHDEPHLSILIFLAALVEHRARSHRS